MKKSGMNFVAVIFILAVHSLLCVIYNKLCFSNGEYLWSELTGIWNVVVSVLMFLFAPVCYYISGRLFTRFANKHFFVGTLWVIFSVLSVMGVVAIFVPELEGFYLMINSPSYMYYLLFRDSAIYISVPAMAITGLFPAMFSRNGFVRKKRQKNEITMDELNEKLEADKEK